MPRLNIALPKPNLLDRVVSAVNPGAGVRRIQDRVRLKQYDAMQQMYSGGGYDAADSKRRPMRNTRKLNGSADTAVLPALPQLRVASSNLIRNMPLATGALDTIATKVVGTGLRLQARPDQDFLGLTDDQSEAWSAQSERLWQHICRRMDWRRQMSMSHIEYLALHSVLEMGDLFILKTSKRNPGDLFDLKLQLIEAGRCCNEDLKADSKKCAGGVEFDDSGVPVAYWFADGHPYDFGLTSAKSLKWQRVEAFNAESGRKNVIHLMAPKRVDQTRGVPLLAPVIEDLQQLSDYTEAELMAAVVNSCFAIVSKTEDGSDFPETSETQPTSGDLSRVGLTFEAGMVLEGLTPNESVESFTPNRPNQAFEAFFTAIVRQIGVALGLSFEVLVRHFTASYSASRAALLEVWEMIRQRRAWLTAQLHQDIYEEMLAEAVDQNLIAARGWENSLVREAWSRAKWIGPTQGLLNPLMEVKAANEKVSGGLSTEQEQTVELTGGDWRSNLDQRRKEIKLRTAAGLPPIAGTPVQIGHNGGPPMTDDKGPVVPDDDAPEIPDDDTEDETRKAV